MLQSLTIIIEAHFYGNYLNETMISGISVMA